MQRRRRKKCTHIVPRVSLNNGVQQVPKIMIPRIISRSFLKKIHENNYFLFRKRMDSERLSHKDPSLIHRVREKAAKEGS